MFLWLILQCIVEICLVRSIAFPAVWGLCPLQEGLVNIPYGPHKGLYTWLPIFPLSSVGVCSYTQIWPDIEVCRGWSRASDFWVTHSACLFLKKGMKEQLACLPVQDPSGVKELPSTAIRHSAQIPISAPLLTPFFPLRLLLIFLGLSSGSQALNSSLRFTAIKDSCIQSHLHVSRLRVLCKHCLLMGVEQKWTESGQLFH